ncbi:MAG: ATP-binding protein [Cognatishimia sp.]|uniref:ATP-binding protein n=1 Tax=Cognatishimia sp. TaxID=2211648 RepID=UPI0040587CE5
MRRSLTIVMFLVAVGVFSAAIWNIGYRTALTGVSDQGRVYLQSASDRLVGQLERFRQLADLIAHHPEAEAAISGEMPVADILPLFTRSADSTGALEVGLIDLDGELVLASGDSASGQDWSAADHFKRAMTGAMGFTQFVDVANRRIFSFMAPVRTDGIPAGAIMVNVDMETIEESDWRSTPQVVLFTDSAQKVFVTNRSELLFDAFSTAPESTGFAPRRVRKIGSQDVWTLPDLRYVPERALYMELPRPVVGMTGHTLISTAPAERIAGLQALVAAAVCLTFGAFLFFAMERRRVLARDNQLLEQRVTARTAQLTAVNVNLRHEIAERQEAEEALRKAQADLIQAGKLTALGQMSAGISHELNQPLMAIRSFADNGALFLERENAQEASENFNRISALSHRMGRIIKNLRAFARQESEPVSDVDLSNVVDAVLELAEPRLKGDDITVHRPTLDAPIWVRGGEVRLQQVLMNLVSNAADAMQNAAEKTLEINISTEGSKVILSVADTGPGLDAADKIFDPFYTTKEVGQSEGMGLGLSISYGLVQSFGGAIHGRNREKGGAVFTVELAAGKEKA